MSPERLQGRSYDGSADVYSLGVTLYQMLSGQKPYKTEPGAPWTIVVSQLLEDPVPLRQVCPEIGEGLATVVMSALSKDPRQRPAPIQLARLFTSALDEGAASLETPAPTRRPSQEVSRTLKIDTPS